jgi:hypothetical protein
MSAARLELAGLASCVAGLGIFLRAAPDLPLRPRLPGLPRLPVPSLPGAGAAAAYGPARGRPLHVCGRSDYTASWVRPGQ